MGGRASGKSANTDRGIGARARSSGKRLIRAVLFDLDGTLYHAPDYTAAFRKEVIAYAARRLRRTRRAVRELLQQAERAGKSLTQTLADAGLPKQEWHAVMARRTSLLALIPPDPSVSSLFWTLRAEGYRVGILTNAARKIARAILSRLGVSPGDYSLLLTGSEAAPKPRAEPFLRAAEALGTPVNEIAYVGDRFTQEVLPAVRLGMLGILVDRGSAPPPPRVLVVQSLHGILAVLRAHTTPPPQVVVWISGRPAAGKTTTARLLHSLLRARGVPAVVLDSDDLREAVITDPAFSASEKALVYRLLFSTAGAVSRSGAVAVIAATGFSKDLRREARALFPRYLEVYLHCPLSTAIQRDPKSLYARALSGEISTLPGVSLPYEEPETAHLVIDTTRASPRDTARRILNAMLKV